MGATRVRSAYDEGTGATPASFSFDVGSSGSDRYVVLLITTEVSGGTGPPYDSGATVGGVAGTMVQQQYDSTVDGTYLAEYYWTESDLGVGTTGSQTVTWTATGFGTSNSDWRCTVYLYTNAEDQAPTASGKDHDDDGGTPMGFTGVTTTAGDTMLFAQCANRTGKPVSALPTGFTLDNQNGEHMSAYDDDIASAHSSATLEVTYDFGGVARAGTVWLTFAEKSGASAQTLTESYFTDADVTYAETVAPGAVGLTETNLDDADVTFAETLAFPAQALTETNHVDADSFSAETVSPGAVGLTEPNHDDGDTFPAETLSPGAVGLTEPYHTDADATYAETIAAAGSLQETYYDDPDQTHAEAVTVGAVTLSESIFTDPDQFFAEAVTSGITVVEPFHTDGDVFYAEDVAAAAELLETYFEDADTHPTEVVAIGPATLLETYLEDADVTFAEVVEGGIRVIINRGQVLLVMGHGGVRVSGMRGRLELAPTPSGIRNR